MTRPDPRSAGIDDERLAFADEDPTLSVAEAARLLERHGYVVLLDVTRVPAASLARRVPQLWPRLRATESPDPTCCVALPNGYAGPRAGVHARVCADTEA